MNKFVLAFALIGIIAAVNLVFFNHSPHDPTLDATAIKKLDHQKKIRDMMIFLVFIIALFAVIRYYNYQAEVEEEKKQINERMANKKRD